RQPDHAHHAAVGHQQGLRPDAQRRVDPQRGDLLMAAGIRVLSEHACFGGVQGFYTHDSQVCGAEMRFSVYRPPQAAAGPVPVLWYLAGLTCTDETFMIKAGAQRLAAEL